MESRDDGPSQPNLTPVTIIQLGVFEKSLLSKQLHDLEKTITYPLGDDTFQIDHGADYFSFFKRMGEVQSYGIIDDGKLVAVGMGILRTVSFQKDEKARRAWYLCDLKVAPTHRGRHLPLRILRKAFLRCYIRCGRGYAVSMNTPQNEKKGDNRIVKLLARFPWAPSRLGGILNIYSCETEEMNRWQSIIEKHRGPISYLNLIGQKDLILKSTNRSLPLMHVQFGQNSHVHGARLSPAPVKGFSHMFCAPAGDALSIELESLGLRTTATASIIHHRMTGCDWRFILTSDI